MMRRLWYFSAQFRIFNVTFALSSYLVTIGVALPYQTIRKDACMPIYTQ